MLILLPLYPNTIAGFVYSVNLITYAEATSFNRLVYWILFVSLVMIGVFKILLVKFGGEKGNKMMTGLSMLLSIFVVLFLALAREAYAVTLAFMLLVIKGVLLLKYTKSFSTLRRW